MSYISIYTSKGWQLIGCDEDPQDANYCAKQFAILLNCPVACETR